jgi:hypothetical protein
MTDIEIGDLTITYEIHGAREEGALTRSAGVGQPGTCDRRSAMRLVAQS